MTEFGICGVRQDTELLDGIDGGLQHQTAVNDVKIIGAVDEEIVGFGALAVDGVCLAFAGETTRFEQAWGEGYDAGLQDAELRELAAVQG